MKERVLLEEKKGGRGGREKRLRIKSVGRKGKQM